MQEWWSTRWYAPLVALGAGLLVVLGVALVSVAVFTETSPRSVTPRTWTPALTRLDEAQAAGDAAGALSWWREANAAALRSGLWESMLEVGDGARRLDASTALARQAYLTAFFRARHQGSLDGLLQAAARFGALGEHEVLAQTLNFAEREAGLDRHARERVQVVAERWSRTPLTTEHRDPRYPGGQLP
jgi:hypothetical protein